MTAAMERKGGLLQKLAAFGRCVDDSSLYIVLAIDSTISALEEVDQIARALSLSCESLTDEVSMNPAVAGCLLDPDGKIVEDLAASRQRIDDLLPGLIAQSATLAQMDVSDQDQRDLVNFAFERCMVSFSWVVSAVVKLRHEIVTHDQESLRSDAA